MRFIIATALLCLVATSAASQAEAKRAPHAPVPVVDCFTDRGYGPCGAGGSHWFEGTPVKKEAKRSEKRERDLSQLDKPKKAKTFEEGWNTPAIANVSGGLVSRARAYMGQTARQIGLSRSTLWCAAFMNHIVGRKGSDLARDYAHVGRPASPGCVGCVAVLTRGKRGGHVGVVTGYQGGNPIIVSGNHNRRVGEGAYPRGRVIAWRWV